jgi:F0F1-type ATP synthase assembly protein I
MDRINNILLGLVIAAILLVIAGIFLKLIVISIIGLGIGVVAIVNDEKQCAKYRKDNPDCSPWDFL